MSSMDATVTSDMPMVENANNRLIFSASPSQYGKNYMWESMTYKQLQQIARIHGMPCNLKKYLLKSLVEAKMQGKHEEVDVIIKQVKHERLERKKQRDEQARLARLFMEDKKMPVLKQEGIVTVNPENGQRKSNVRELLLQMVNKTSTPNVTICHTQMKAQYRSYTQPVGQTSAPTHHQPLNCYSSDPHPGTWTVPPGDHSAMPYMARYSCACTSQCQCQQVSYKDLPALTMAPYQGVPLDPPPIAICHTNMDRNSGAVLGRTSTPYPLDEFLNWQQPMSVPHAASLNYDSSAQSNGRQTVIENTNPQALPPFKVLYNNRMKKSETVVKPEPMPVWQTEATTALDCLATTAMSQQHTMMREHTNYYNRPFLGEASGSSRSIQRNELMVSNYKTTGKDIPTWNSFLEQMSSIPPAVVTVNCKFGCHTSLASKSQQVAHEVHCLRQSIQCPFPHCIWFNQLIGLSTHILSVHNHEMVSSSEARFELTLDKEECNDSYSVHYEAPKKLCFLQLVNRRLFIISVLANLRNMQLILYIEFINDNMEQMSSAAVDLCRQDGLMWQWIGGVYPISYGSLRLVARRKCLILNLSNDPSVPNKFTLFTKIRHHQVPLHRN